MKKTYLKTYGLYLLLSNHPEIKKLKKIYQPSNHGNKVWKTSWLLIDYLKKTSLISSKHHVLDVGCGWGLSGIYCAKKYKSKVTCTDIDSAIYPYLNLHAEINNTNVKFLNVEFNKIKSRLLKNIDVIIGADICFWENLIDPLRRLIQRAKRSSVGLVLLADPGRPTFDDLAKCFINHKGTEILEWEIKNPYHSSGKILKIKF